MLVVLVYSKVLFFYRLHDLRIMIIVLKKGEFHLWIYKTTGETDF